MSVFPRSFDGSVRAAWDEPERVAHANQLGNGFARAVLERRGLTSALEIASFSDVPHGTGLAGSGAFTTALIAALSGANPLDRRSIAEEAFLVETSHLGRPVGKQDPYFSAVGGLNALHIASDSVVDVETLPVASETRTYIAERLLLFYTGIQRDAAKALSVQESRTSGGDLSAILALDRIRDIAHRLLPSLRLGRTSDIGPLLNEHWRYKKEISEAASSGRIDDLYELGLRNGADGGKILGAGGGGFLLLSADSEGSVERLRAAMAREGLRELRFGISEQGVQSTSIQL
ncbi:hypothetical protein ACPPVW_01580 [Leifsonia sp. McL0607]|uniref:GHMP family kinase ATP-binding protein n=1 Tax=Leifsonia sp. McL0607 TaxID=3415672 RepID=UPI003CE79523